MTNLVDLLCPPQRLESNLCSLPTAFAAAYLETVEQVRELLSLNPALPKCALPKCWPVRLLRQLFEQFQQLGELFRLLEQLLG